MGGIRRRPLGSSRGYRRRLTRVGESVAAAAFEVATVTTWFALLTRWERTVTLALLGLAVLLFGTLLRRVLVGRAFGGERASNRSLSLLALSVFEAACWVTWLLVAEWVDGLVGIVVAGAVLGVVFLAQNAVEWVVDALYGDPFRLPIHGGVVGVTLAKVLGASLLLWAITASGWPRAVVGDFTVDLDHIVGAVAFVVVLAYARYRRVRYRSSARVE